MNSQEQTKQISNTDPSKHWGGVNSRDTYNIDEQAKNKLNTGEG
jgi:hypothetical protein